MAIEISGTPSSTNDEDQNTTVSFAHTIPSGSNRMLIVTIGLEDDSPSNDITDVQWNSSSLTQLSQGTTTFNRVEIWYMSAPDVATDTIDITVDTGANSISAGAVDFTGVAQEAPEVVSSIVAGSDNPSQESITTATDDSMIIDVICEEQNDIDLTVQETDQTEQWKQRSFGIDMSTATSTRLVTTAGAFDMGWTNSADWVWGAVAMAPVAVSATVPRLTLLGVG